VDGLFGSRRTIQEITPNVRTESHLREYLTDTKPGIQWLNSLSTVDAQVELLKCCGCNKWAQAMTESRPFLDVNDLLTKAESTWWALGAEDWLEAFRAHPKIGEQKAASAQSEQARNWSAQEQSGVTDAAAEIKTALAVRNQEYEQRFGFIFIVCASGKSSKEMLAILTQRLQNESKTELRVAAEEQQKITRLRLEKLINP
jgi:OHCU decarboxylase